MGDAVASGLCDFIEREHLLSRFLADRTFGFRRNKKESCSTRRGLHVGTYMVEIRQLQEVGIFSYLRYSSGKSRVNG